MTTNRVTEKWPPGSAVVRYFGNAYELCGVGPYTHEVHPWENPCKRCRRCRCNGLHRSYGHLVLTDVNQAVNAQPITALYLEPLTPLAREMLRLVEGAQ